jgi:hypothetical protein
MSNTTTSSSTAVAVNRSRMLQGLNAGICEIQYINTTTGDNETVSVTMRRFNIKDECINDWVDVPTLSQSITVWNVVAEEWMTIPIVTIIFFEQLTGAKVQ